MGAAHGREPRTWFVTGGTPGGFGLALADAALATGDRVAVTARRPHELEDWAREHGERVHVGELDVTDPAGARAAVAEVEAHFGGIDVLVNNAGRGWYGSIEGTPDADVRRSFELNFFAVLDVWRAALPAMRERGSGWVVTMSSVAGLRGVPGFGHYSAAKHAVEGATAVLRHELAPYGIRVLAVEPGAFRTRAYAGVADAPQVETVTAYRGLLDRVRAAFVEQDGVQPGDPRRGARAVVQTLDLDVPPHRLVLGGVGYDAVVGEFEAALADVRASEQVARAADYPPGQ